MERAEGAIDITSLDGISDGPCVFTLRRVRKMLAKSVVCSSAGMAGEQFITGGPYLNLYKDGQWNQLLGWHHTTMYFFFGLMGIAQILCFTTNLVPLSLSKLMLSNAFFVECKYEGNTFSVLLLSVGVGVVLLITCLLFLYITLISRAICLGKS